MRVAIETLGCRSNYFDSHVIKTALEEKGYSIVSPEEEADIYIVNTCTVTRGGDRSSRQAIYRFRRKNPNSIIIATGCYAQVNPEELAEIKDVDIVIGNSHKDRIGDIIESFLVNREGRVFHENIFRKKEVNVFKPVVFFENARPFVKVQEGCNRFCTFCVVPYARGKVRSVDIKEVIDILKYIADRGFEEVVLSGTQLSQYGWDKGYSLYDLLAEAVKIEGIKLIRISSLHVREIDEKTIDLLINEEKIAPHFHFPLQSASDKILRLKETVEFVKSFPFAYLHVFPYSERPFTKATRLKEKVEEKVKKERVEVLKEIDEDKRKSFRDINRGKKLRATVIDNEKLLTENYIDINLRCDAPKGKVIEVCVP